jgi:hypothetical protein
MNKDLRTETAMTTPRQRGRWQKSKTAAVVTTAV